MMAGKSISPRDKSLMKISPLLKFREDLLHPGQRADPVVDRFAAGVLPFGIHAAQAFVVTLHVRAQAVEFRQPLADLRQQAPAPRRACNVW